MVDCDLLGRLDQPADRQVGHRDRGAADGDLAASAVGVLAEHLVLASRLPPEGVSSSIGGLNWLSWPSPAMSG